MSGDKEIFEKMYEKPGAVWTAPEPPKELVELIETKKVKPCKALDVGCGEGFYSLYLASNGFEVTGIDISENAIEKSKENSAKNGAKIKFLAMDISDLGKLDDKFDFVFEWTLLHHIPFSQRQKYVEDLSKLLNTGGRYLSVCFNDQDSHLGRPGKKIRTIPEDARILAGAKLHFSSMAELKELFQPRFRVIESKLIQITAGRPHIGNYFFMEKPASL